VSEPDGVILLKSPLGPQLRLVPEALEWATYQFWSDPTSAEEMRQFFAAARGRSCFFDVGAHFGAFAVVFALENPGGRAIAFEPMTSSAQVLRQHLRLNRVSDRVTVREVAIGDREGEAIGAVDPAGFATFGRRTEEAQVAFPMSTLDGEVRRAGSVPDLVKIDVEGFELEVLKGGADLLRARRPMVFLELHLDAIEKRGEQPDAVIRELIEYGYSEFRLGGRMVRPQRICDAATSLVRITAA